MIETKSENLEDKADEKNDLLYENSIGDIVNGISGFELEPQQAFGMQNYIIEKNLEFVGKHKIVFASGCNLVCYDLKEKTCEFFLRKFPTYNITSISVGCKNLDEPLICVGESSPDRKQTQITVISSKSPKNHFVLNHNKNDDNGWFVKKAIILKNSPYCLGILMKDNDQSLTKILFWKFTTEKFISEVVLNQLIYDVSYNPKNCLELILCGKGFLRLWNVFINDGSLKEHPQRFLKGKQEKEKSFIKSVFFENKSFMFIVITAENNLYVIEGFKMIFNLNVRFENEIIDLNIDKLLVNTDEDNELEGNISNHRTHNDEEDSLDESSNKLTHNKVNSSKKTSKKITEVEASKTKLFNAVKTFFIIKKKNHYNILLTSSRDSITYLYKLEKELKKITINQVEFSTDECFKFRIAKNIKNIINVVCNEDSSNIIYMCELENDSLNDTRISFFLFERIGNELKFEREIFKEFFFNDQLRFFEYCEKKRILYTITKNNWLRCYDNNNYSFYTKHNFFDETPKTITSSPNNNLFGISNKNSFSLYALLRDDIAKFCEFDIQDSIAKFSKKGEMIAIAGESKINSKFYCIYFVEVFNFQTVHIIDHLPKPIKKILWLDNDKYIMAILENNNIFGWQIDLDYLTVNMFTRIKENDPKSIQNHYFKLFLKHITSNIYIDFDYDWKNDQLLVAHSKMNRLSIYYKFGRKLMSSIETEEIATCLNIIHNLKCLLIGNEKGSIKLYTWPIESGLEKTISVLLKHKLEIFLHSSPITNIFLTANLKQLISASEDGSIYICKMKVIRGDQSYDFDYFDEIGHGVKLPIEQTIKFCEINEYANHYIDKKDKIAENLSMQIEDLLKTNEKLNIKINKQHAAEINILDEQKTEALYEETKKKDFIQREIREMKNSVRNELDHKIIEHEDNKKRILKKNQEKLKIYTNEIARLKKELVTLNDEIKNKFDSLQNEQQDFFKNLSEKNLKIYFDLVEKINESIRKLVLNNCYRDEAIETINDDYKNLIENKKNQYDETIVIDREDKKKNEEALEKTKKIEENNKFKQEKWILESNKIIQKNIQIKQNLNDTTQKIITLQEQLLETEKNLQKIDSELENLTIKNKHLEQIRFVLENRTTSLEKEKSPLEDQCLFLEKQKNNLQEEFNKLVLQIRLSNQGLENKQSQFKACLMQNFEIDEQIKFLKNKLTHLQVELLGFVDSYRNETKKVKFVIRENKPSQVCLNLRGFYDKYFSTPIEDELTNFHYYMQKLQEMSEKANAASNNDLIKRDKATEKLYNEEDKLTQLKKQKEEVFRRMQKENTTLIAECNRLRKNLHEVFMHVVEIESKFEDLTKINPKLNKTEMVYQIKEFIKQTHNKIKSNYMNDDPEDIKPFTSEIENDFNNNFQDQNFILRSMEEHHDKLSLQTKNLDKLKLQVQNIVSDEDSRGDYENFIKLPEIKSNVLNDRGMNTSKMKKDEILPKLD